MSKDYETPPIGHNLSKETPLTKPCVTTPYITLYDWFTGEPIETGDSATLPPNHRIDATVARLVEEKKELERTIKKKDYEIECFRARLDTERAKLGVIEDFCVKLLRKVYDD